MIAAIWIIWAAWVLWHYFVVPPELFVMLDGDLLPVPHWREAVGRTIVALTAAAVIVLTAWGAGAFLLRAARTMFSDFVERLLFELAAGFAVLSFAFLALASVGLYRPVAVWVVLAVGSCAAGVSLFARRRTKTPRPRLSPPWKIEDVLFVSVAALAIAFALVSALAPETEYDALWYHLWLPKVWLAAGRPVDLVHEYPSLYPQTWELLFGAAMTLGGPIAARLLHFVCLPLVGLAAARLAALVLPHRGAAAAAGALAVVSPTVIWEATTAYIDLALAWYLVLSVYALVRYAGTHDRPWLILSASTMGMGMAIKHLGLIAFAIVGSALAIVELRRTSLVNAARAFLVFAALALLPPAPYYLRAYLASGNPVFPDLYRVFGAEPPERWSDVTERGLLAFKHRFGRERTLRNLVALPWDVTVHGARYGGSAGPLFLLLLPLGLLAGPAVRWILLGCGLYVLVWASPLSSFQFRFLVPIVPLVAVAAAAGLQRLPRKAGFLVVPLLLFNLPPFTAWHEPDKEEWNGWLTHVTRQLPVRVVVGAESQDRYLARVIPSFRAWRFANKVLPTDSRVLTFFGGDHLYSSRNRLSSEATAARPATWGAPAGRETDARQSLNALGITHVLIDRRQVRDGDAGRLAITSEAMRRCCLDAIYEDDRSVLYRVR